jgi:hypothetical protein
LPRTHVCTTNATGCSWPRWCARLDLLPGCAQRPAGQLNSEIGSGASATIGLAAASDFPGSFWKHDRQSTGRPWVGLNGTVVSVPHSEHVVRVSDRTRGPPRTRLALHCLQCLGSFLNCLSWKNNCSPAVNTKSAPQSLHFNTLSMNSMAGFPGQGRIGEIGHV